MKSYLYEINKNIKNIINKDDYKEILEAKSILIQLFSGEDKEKVQAILNELVVLFKNATIITTSTDGEIINDKVLTQSSILSITTFQKTSLKIAYSVNQDSFLSGQEMASQIITDNTKLLLAFTNGIMCNGEAFLNGIYSVAPDVMVAGGLSGDNAKFEECYVGIQNQIYTQGAVGVSLNSDTLCVENLYNFGWKAIGIKHTVTKARGNRVYTIDNMSAVDFYKKYLGPGISEKLPATGIEFPLIIISENFKKARAVVAKHNDGSLSFAGNVAQGDDIYIGVGEIETILSNHIEKMKNINTEAFFIYSCMSRRRFLPNLIEQEITPFAQLAPTSGFFTYGEFYTDKTQNYGLLNQTMTLLGLSETPHIVNTTPSVPMQSCTKKREKTLKALAHFLDTTANELEDEKNFIKAILDSQENFVITTNAKEIISANRSFLNFFNVESGEEFKDKIGSCVYDVFVKDNLNVFSKEITKENWLEYIGNDNSRVYEVILKQETKEYIFTISVEELHYKGDALKSVVFTDVTEVVRTKQRVNTLLKDTKESIEYASMIQESILPLEKHMRKVFDECFILNKSKDGAKTQIYNFNKIRKNEYLLSILDSKQEGVKGIFSTMFFNAIEKQIINTLVGENIEDISTQWILQEFIQKISTHANFHADKVEDYFEGIIIYCNLEKNIVRFSGVKTPFFYIQDKKLQTIEAQIQEIEIDIQQRLDFFIATNNYLKNCDSKRLFLPFDQQKELFKKDLQDKNINLIMAGFTIDFEETILVEYRGEFTQEKMTQCMDKLEDTIDNIGVFGNISTIFAEQYQNILKYSKSKDEDIESIVPYGYIQVQRNKQGVYEVNSSNILSLEDKQKIEPKLMEIDSLDRNGIRKRYRELRKSGANTHQKGGGIGFYEIAKRCSSLEYEFKPLSKTRFEFKLRSILSNKK